MFEHELTITGLFSIQRWHYECHCAYDVSQGYQAENQECCEECCGKEGSSEKPHDPKTFKRPVLHKEFAIGTSATIQQRNKASLWFAPVS